MQAKYGFKGEKRYFVFSLTACTTDQHLSSVLMKMPHTQHARTTRTHQSLHWQTALREQDARPQLKHKLSHDQQV